MNISTQIKLLRIDLALTQEQFSKKLNTTQSVVSRMENPKYKGHSMRILNVIAKKFKLKLHVYFE